MWRGYADRPTSNPLPPGTQAFPKYQRMLVLLNRSSLIVLRMKYLTLELSSRLHFYPDKSCTILMKNMYNGPGIAWEQEDEEGLEVFLPVCFFIIFFNLHQTFMDSLQWSIQIRKLNEEFYEDVHTEFQKYGELVNFKWFPASKQPRHRPSRVHLTRVGDVSKAYPSPSRTRCVEMGRAMYTYTTDHWNHLFLPTSPLTVDILLIACEVVNISRWKVAICGERALVDLLATLYTVSETLVETMNGLTMTNHLQDSGFALFGYSDEYVKHMEFEYSGSLSDLRSDQPTDSHRQPSRQSRSRDHGHINVGSKPCHRSSKNLRDTRGP
ncbi:BnaC05g07860D [Brassica napus]|uniref:(rape) hypothetical protein n=1 Tax=Brassica napus TaxID=3708 RepID=A0A078HMC7_BRANA|nr:unnamed protein product [Brassica napus]CDY37988.1 BnaC05g07860D [Brassica napus]